MTDSVSEKGDTELNQTKIIERNSKIEWPSWLKAIPEMCYESITPINALNRHDFFGEKMAFAVSCSKHFIHPNGVRGSIQKLEVHASPNFSDAKMQITHEVLPNKGACSQIVDVNEKLKVACFDEGVILPIKNFGYKKTFHCDVRGGLQNHTAPVNVLAVNKKCNQVASGATNGEISLYETREEEISFVTRSKVSQSFVTGLTFFRTAHEVDFYTPVDEDLTNDENKMIYSTSDGCSGLIDTRCKFGTKFQVKLFMKEEPRWNLTSLCFMRDQPAPVICYGTSTGEIFTVDLRFSSACLYRQDLPEDGCIRRMKKVVVKDAYELDRTFLAYTNQTNKLKILDSISLRPSDIWVCDREPESSIQDFCQIGNRLVTCGANTSIGCWIFEDKTNPDRYASSKSS